MDYNTPQDTWNHPLAPWNEPDQIIETKVICWCCDEEEEDCECEDGFDGHEVICDD